MRGGGSTAWFAEPADPLWALPQQRAAASRPWVAQAVQNVYTAPPDTVLLAASYQFDPTGVMKAMRYNVHFAAAQAGQPALPDTSNMEVNIRIPLLGETTIQHMARM